jgi:hypothetical protein
MTELYSAPSRDQIDDQDHDGHDEHQMDERADVNNRETEKPQNQQDYEDSPKHMFSFELVYFTSRVGPRVRLKIFYFCALSSREEPLWRVEEITGFYDSKALQRECSFNSLSYAL